MLNLDAKNCIIGEKDKKTEENKIKKLEHVQIKVSLDHICRGRVDMILISPSGTKSQILKPRPLDKSTKGIKVFKK